MSAIDRDCWERASPHLDRVLDLAPSEREAYLLDLRDRAPETAADLEGLLAEHRLLTAECFLDTPPAMPRETGLAGVTIGAYTLASPIGQGGMGSVWSATRSDGRFEGRVAVKLLNAALVGRA